MAAKLEKTAVPGIYRRPSNSRYVVVVLDGKGRQRWETAPTLKAARSLKTARLSARDRGGLRERTKVTFGQACAEWLQYLEGDRQRRPSTLRDYRSTVERHLIPAFGGDTPLAKISKQRIEDFRERLLAESKLSRRTAQKTLTLLHGILRRAKRRGWIYNNPAEDVERVSVRRDGSFAVLTSEEVLAVARGAENDQDAVLFIVAGFGGLRQGELLALRWSDVDFALSSIHVRRNYTHGAHGPPKSGLVRSVPMADHVARALDRLSRREHFTASEDLVFGSVRGHYRDGGDVRRAFYRALEAAQLGHKRSQDPPLTFHSLRHTFGCLAVRVWPLPDVQAVMGHADIKTTMGYIHYQPRASAAAELTQLVEAQGTNGALTRALTDPPALSGTEPHSPNGNRAQSTSEPDADAPAGNTAGNF
jgi:integrase